MLFPVLTVNLLCIRGTGWSSECWVFLFHVVGLSENGYALRFLILWKCIHSIACLTIVTYLVLMKNNMVLHVTSASFSWMKDCSVSIIWFAGILSSCFYSPFCEICILGCSWEMDTSEGSWNSCGSPIWWWHGQQWSWSQCTWCWSDFCPRVC